MENVVQFIEEELNAITLLTKIKTINKAKYNKYVQAFKEFQEIDFDSFTEQESLNKFKLAKYIIVNPPAIVTFINGFDEDDDNLQKYVTDILKLYYLHAFVEYKANSFEQYLFTKYITEAVDIISEFQPTLSNHDSIVLLIKFVNNQHQIVKSNIEFERLNRKLIPLLGFIGSLTASFRKQFDNDKYIPFLIEFLYENGYVDSYGSWINKKRRGSELLGLIDALKTLNYIKKADSAVKISFRNTFRSKLTNQYLTRNEYSQVRQDAQDFFVVAVKELYINKMPSKAVI